MPPFVTTSDEIKNKAVTEWRESQLFMGAYTLTSLLSTNTPSMVYSAQLTSTKQQLAIKNIKLPLEPRARHNSIHQLEQRFRPLIPENPKETEESGGDWFIRFHPNIVRHFAADDIQETVLEEPYYRVRMELLQGQTLRKVAQSRQLKEAELSNVARQLLDGLCFLHDENTRRNPYVHRNLDAVHAFVTGTLSDLTDPKTVIKITGLGTAKQLQARSTQTNEVSFNDRSSSLYRSPEMVQSYFDPLVKVGRKTDVWSLGVLLLESACKGQVQFMRDMDSNSQVMVAGKTDFAINDLILPVREDVTKGHTPDYTVLGPEMGKLKGFLERCFIRRLKSDEKSSAIRPSAEKLQTDAFITDYSRTLLSNSTAVRVANSGIDPVMDRQVVQNPPSVHEENEREPLLNQALAART